MAQLQINRYQQIFQSKSFRRFWPGYTLSMVGDSMTRVALTWYVLQVTGSARAVGLLTLVNLGPVAVGGLMAGVLLDRFGRRRVMLIDSLVRGLVVASVPLAYAFDSLALWHVYVVAGVYGLLMMITAAGGPSLVPSLVRDEHLSTANALEMVGFTLSNVLGPPIAGLLIDVISAPNILIIDALTYFAFALALTGVRPLPGADGAVEGPAEGDSYGLGDAVRLLTGNTVLLSITLMYMTGNIGLGMLFVWLPILSDRMAGGAQLYGFLLGIMAAGEMTASVLAGTLSFSIALGTLIAVAQSISGLVLGIPLFGQVGWLIAISLGLYGFVTAPLTIWAQTIRMQIIPPPLRGRTFALLRTLMVGTIPAGGALAGFLIPALGIPLIMAISAGTHLVPGLVGSQVRELRRAGPPTLAEAA